MIYYGFLLGRQIVLFQNNWLFYKDKVGSISIFDLCNLNEIYVKPMSREESFDIDFLPIECVSVCIKFKQE